MSSASFHPPRSGKCTFPRLELRRAEGKCLQQNDRADTERGFGIRLCEVRVRPELRMKYRRRTGIPACDRKCSWSVGSRSRSAADRMATARSSRRPTGPSLESGLVTPAVENVHIYPMIMHILGVPMTTKIDGELSVLAPYLNASESD